MELIQILSDVFKCMDDVEIPKKIVDIVHTIIVIMKFGIPILLIVFGMLDLGKAVMASKEDEIKKGQQMFIKRLIAAILVFLVVVVVELVIGVAAGNEKQNIADCIDGFVKGVDICSGGECRVNP